MYFLAHHGIFLVAASSLVVSLGKALNDYASALEWLDWWITGSNWTRRQKRFLCCLLVEVLYLDK